MKEVKFSENIKKQILKKDWQFGYERKMTYQKIRLFQYAYQKEIPKILKADFGPSLYK